MFILGTSSVLAYVPPDQIDLIGPMPQVLRVGFGPFGIAAQLVTIAILMMLGMRVAQASVTFTAITRLPMVAGWDRLLPRVVHPAAPQVPDAGQLDSVRRRCRVRDRVCEPDRRRPSRRRSSCSGTPAASSTRSPTS